MKRGRTVRVDERGGKSDATIRLVIFDLDETLWTCPGKVCSHLTMPFTKDGPDAIRDTVGRRLTLRPEARPVIATLAQEGIHMSLASMNDVEPVESALELLDIRRYFSFPQFHWRAKDVSIRTILSLMERKGGQAIRPSETLFVDDWASNVAKARELGVQALQMHEEIHSLGEVLDRVRESR